MALQDLRESLRLLESRKNLAHLHTPVSSTLEVTEITDRVSKGPVEENVALLFENVTGFDIPVLINAYGSPRPLARAFGVGGGGELHTNPGRGGGTRPP